MSLEKLIISKHEFEILKKHLSDAPLSLFNKRKLMDELEHAELSEDSKIPEDVIRLDSEVEIEAEDTLKRYNFTVVLPAKANIHKNRISVFAPIGIALLGYREGSVVQWEMPDGLKKFRVLKVSKNP